MRIASRPRGGQSGTGTAPEPSSPHPAPPAESPARVAASGRFEDYTLGRYHDALARLYATRTAYLLILVAMVLIVGYVFSGIHPAPNPMAARLAWLTIAWLLPVPLLLLSTAVFFGWFSVRRFALHPVARTPTPDRPTVIFQVTSTGVNTETVLNTVRSALYWTRRHPEVGFTTRVWLVVEGWGYGPNRQRLDVLRNEGVEIVVVPTDYQTRKGTTRKGRALQYATERRRELGLSLDRLWVYHQDDETAVGEDTVLGIDEFVATYHGAPALGCGIILYSQGAEDFRPSQIQEFSRTKDDLRTIFTITSRNNLFSGFHGSHYLVRGDLEDATGWDVGPDMNSEDLIFETRVRAQHGSVFHLLKGFAHEQAALTVPDQLKQRRRWFQGWWRAVIHQPFDPLRRVVMSYGMVVWMGAIFSLLAMVLSWVYGYSSVYPYAGFLTGFVWTVMVGGYYQGYVLHVPYLPPRRVPLVRVVANGVIGALADAVGPWYGTFTRRPRGFQVIAKDRHGGTSAGGPARPGGVGAALGPGFAR